MNPRSSPEGEEKRHEWREKDEKKEEEENEPTLIITLDKSEREKGRVVLLCVILHATAPIGVRAWFRNVF